MSFKNESCFMDQKELNHHYSLLADSHIQRESDLSAACVRKILQSIVGSKVLDIGCGRGALAEIIFRTLKLNVTGIDIHISKELAKHPRIRFLQGNIEEIDFPNRFFDTVICTHTLEHVLNLEKAISELRRVSKRRLIVVVPLQREYKYTFDLHIHFFPYPFSLNRIMKNKDGHTTIINNDLFYFEDIHIDKESSGKIL